MTLGEEEYEGNDGSIKTRLYVVREFSIDKIGEQKVPELKKLKTNSQETADSDEWMSVSDSNEEAIKW